MWLHDLWALIWPGGTFLSGFTAVWPNILASIVIGGALYAWKIRPHLKRTAAHREHVAQQLAELHAKHDALHEKLGGSDGDK